MPDAWRVLIPFSLTLSYDLGLALCGFEPKGFFACSLLTITLCGLTWRGLERYVLPLAQLSATSCCCAIDTARPLAVLTDGGCIARWRMDAAGSVRTVCLLPRFLGLS